VLDSDTEDEPDDKKRIKKEVRFDPDEALLD